MKSEDRKAARRERREDARRAQRDKVAGQYDCYESVISANALYKAARLSRRTIRWKASVQRYFMNLLRNIWDTRKRLQKGLSVVMGFICFTICDRGRKRGIRSVHFKERVAQRSLCDNALVPMLSRSLIYDNGASLKGKGIHRHLKRCRAHLQQFYRENGFSNDGWVLLIDFTHYFDNIEHAPLLERLNKAFRDKRIVRLAWQFIACFGKKSLGIGSQVSQILAVAYPNRIDHFAKERLHLRFFGRYMDDTYAIHRDRAYLEDCLAQLTAKYAELGIQINLKKTCIIPVKHFTFLKVRFFLTDTGKVVMMPGQKNITKMRKKLKSFKVKLDKGEMTMEDIRCAYQSWRGYQKHLNSHRAIREMDRLYHELFGEWPATKKERRKKHEQMDLHGRARPGAGQQPREHERQHKLA